MKAEQRRFLLHRGLEGIPEPLRGGAVAIGNFDGVHLGHQAVMGAALAAAQAAGMPAVVLTFDPHPREVFAPASPLFPLTPLGLKAQLVEALGLTGMVVLPFDRDFAALEAEAFVQQVLVGALRARHLAVGFDFHFGRARQGTPEFLKESGARKGLAVSIVPPLMQGGAPVSSSRIRSALEEGDVAEARNLLGYAWTVQAEVRHGDKRGRTLGYPTANLALGPAVGLRHGIYAVMTLVEGEWRRGVASFGRRPTFGDGAPLLEVFLFDFRGDLYGRTLTVAFVGFLRPEERFDSVEALVRQMDEDSARARALLAAPWDPGSPLNRVHPVAAL